MWPAPVFAAGVMICLTIMRPAALGVAVPILLIWFASPAIAWWISLPLTRGPVRLTLDQATKDGWWPQEREAS